LLEVREPSYRYGCYRDRAAHLVVVQITRALMPSLEGALCSHSRRGQSLRRRKGTSVCLWMSGVQPLVIGGTNEGLQRVAELHRMLSADVQVKRVASLVPFNQLEMVGYIVP
jgi:hypothetical protein